MRCLNCQQEGIPISAELCENCGVYLPSLSRDLLSPGTILRNQIYRIDYALARGGFGVTYRGIHLPLDRLVAIKEYYPDEYVTRNQNTKEILVTEKNRDAFQNGLINFVKEGRILTSIQHRNIVQVFDLFYENETAYLVMDLVKGHTLREEINKQPKRRLIGKQINKIMKPLIKALELLHKLEIYHLDIKPDNIMINDLEEIVLIDFGTAGKGLNSKAFTIEYAAPELMTGGKISAASDIFSLGMILYEMITGNRPPAVLERVLNDSWIPVNLSKKWSNLILPALRLNIDERPQKVVDWWTGKNDLSGSSRSIKKHIKNKHPLPAKYLPTAELTQLSLFDFVVPPVSSVEIKDNKDAIEPSSNKINKLFNEDNKELGIQNYHNTDVRMPCVDFGHLNIPFLYEAVNNFSLGLYYFTVIEGADLGWVFFLENSETIIGRSDEVGIQIDDEKVSRKHLKVTLIREKENPVRTMVADLGSRNGIYINGVHAYEQELFNGDKLKTGNTFLRFSISKRLYVFYFTIIEGESCGKQFILNELPINILGRCEEVDIQINDKNVSRKHLKFTLVKHENNQESLVISDLNSKFGTFINGKRIQEQKVFSGDKVKVGDTIFVVKIKESLSISSQGNYSNPEIIDKLTGLFNRKFFNSELESSILNDSKKDRSLIVMLIDIDSFYKLNYTFGFDSGDEVLRVITSILLNNLISHSVLARSRDVFYILMRDTNLDTSIRIAESIRQIIANYDFSQTGCISPVTISIGIAEYPSCGRDSSMILQKIQTSLSIAKSKGGNRICVAQKEA